MNKITMIDLDLPLFLKETQLQHGLRGEDYDRYHRYVSNRVATLRKQLHLSNDKKKFLYKEITPSNASSANHFLLLAFYAERCWSSAEAMQTLLGDKGGSAGSRSTGSGGGSAGGRPAPAVVGEKNVKGGFPPPGQFRKRLNKAVKWAEKLVTLAEAVGCPRVQHQCQAYLAEVKGRCYLAHGNERSAKMEFQHAREIYYDLLVASLTGSWKALQEGRSGTSSTTRRTETVSLAERKEEESRSVLQQKVYEMDDRVVYCLQRLKEDVSAYSPPSVEAAIKLYEASTQKPVVEGSGAGDNERNELSTGGEAFSSAWWWSGRPLTVYSMKIKDAVREALAVPVEELERKALEHHSTEDRNEKSASNDSHPSSSQLSGPRPSFLTLPANKGMDVVPVGLVNRVLDALDRRIGYYNDALGHARQDLRAAVEETTHRTTLQLIVHYLLYHVAEGTLHRRLFLADMHARRFQATERALQYKAERGDGAAALTAPSGAKLKKKNEILPPSQYASPIEVIRLYETAMETVEEMGLLPGVAGQDHVEAYEALCAAGKSLYIGEACRIKGDLIQAEVGYRTAMDLLSKKNRVLGLSQKTSKTAEKQKDQTVKKEGEKNRSLLFTRAELMYDRAEQLALQVASMRVLHSSSSSLSGHFSSLPSISYLTEAVTPSLSFHATRENTGNDCQEASQEAGELVAAVAKHVMPFPPSYQIAPAKPTFVDIAWTYMDFCLDESTEVYNMEHLELEEKPSAVPTSTDHKKDKHVDAFSSSLTAGDRVSHQKQPIKKETTATMSDSATTDQGKKKWGFKWGWGSS